MLDLSSEIERLRPQLGDARTDALLARERREVVSLHPEVRIAAWAGALLIAAAVGLFIKDHFDLFDRAFLAALIGALALGCYAWAWRGERSIVNEYVLLLGALLLSADVGFIEQQWDVFGAAGARHLLLLAIVHAATAYRFESKLVLSVSLASLAAWMGLDRQAVDVRPNLIALSLRAFACAAIVLAWRFIDRRYRPRSEFSRVFEHFAANLALIGGLFLLDDAPFTAALLTTAVAAAVILWGFRVKVESFVLYGFAYAVIADVAFAMERFRVPELVMLIAMLIAIPSLVLLHRRFRRTAGC